MHDAISPALRTLLHSLGQIVLQANAFTGACVLAALTICDVRLACAALLGAATANINALLTGHDEHDLHAGLRGFNGALAALAACVFIDDTPTAMAIAILAATAAAWLQAPCARRLRSMGLGFYSSPCLLVTWIWLALARPHALVAQTSNDAQLSTLTISHAAHAMLAGIAQTTFAHGVWPGALILLGIAAVSRRHAIWALSGAALASAVHVLCGTTDTSLADGLTGFNGALTALALADCGLLPTLAGVVLSVVAQRWANALDWPAMTAPFVAASWCVLGFMRRMNRNAHEVIDTHYAASHEPVNLDRHDISAAARINDMR